MKKWSELFLILEKYGLERYDIEAEHDVVYLGVDWNVISLEDRLWLDDFGVHLEDEGMQIYV